MASTQCVFLLVVLAARSDIPARSRLRKEQPMSHSEDNNRDRDLAGLLGEPPILPGESENRYAALRGEVERTINPKTIFEQMRVQTLTDTIWEEMRYKRFGAKLIDGARVNALALLLTPFMSFFRQHATSAARDYYSPNPTRS